MYAHLLNQWNATHDGHYILTFYNMLRNHDVITSSEYFQRSRCTAWKNFSKVTYEQIAGSGFELYSVDLVCVHRRTVLALCASRKWIIQERVNPSCIFPSWFCPCNSVPASLMISSMTVNGPVMNCMLCKVFFLGGGVHNGRQKPVHWFSPSCSWPFVEMLPTHSLSNMFITMAEYVD